MTSKTVHVPLTYDFERSFFSQFSAMLWWLYAQIFPNFNYYQFLVFYSYLLFLQYWYRCNTVPSFHCGWRTLICIVYALETFTQQWISQTKVMVILLLNYTKHFSKVNFIVVSSIHGQIYWLCYVFMEIYSLQLESFEHIL